VIPVAILGRYARALAEVAFEENNEDRVVEDLRMFSAIFSKHSELYEVFDSPAIPRDEKEKLLDALLAEHPVTPAASNFLRVLLERNRIHWIRSILDLVIELVNKRRGIVSARIVTAAPLDRDGIGRIEKRLGNITGKTVVAAAVETDENLLGGMVVSVGNTVYDGSVRTRLEEMKRRLAEGQVVT
jgi:F-type H+-transporting ATPase subunit delta